MAVRVTDGALSWNATIDDSDLNKIADKIEARIGNLSKNVKKEGDELTGVFRNAATAAAGFFSIQAGTNFLQTLVKTRGEFQQLEIAFTTMLGSKERADRLMKEVVQFAATTPFDLQQVAGGTKQLLAYGFAAEGIQDTLSMLGNVASGVGSQINDVIYLYGTLKASGRVTQMDINQFAGRGIPIYEELAKVMGKSVTEIRDLVSAGRVGFPEIEAAFEGMTASGGRFYNLMQEQSKSLTGQISNLQDSFSQMYNEIGRGQQTILSSGIGALATLVENYQTVIDVITVLIATYGVYRAALIVTTALQISSAQAAAGVTLAFKLQYAAIVVLDRAHKLLNATMLANPYVAVATGLAALAGALYLYAQNTSGAAKAQDSLNRVSEDARTGYDLEARKLNGLLEVARNDALSRERRLKAISDINKLAPEHLGNITLETLRTKEATSAIDDYMKSMRRQIELKIANEEMERLIREGNEGPGFLQSAIGSITNFRGLGAGQYVAQAITEGEYIASNLQAINAVKERIREIIEKDDKETPKSTVASSSVRNEDFIKGEIERIEALKKPLDIHSQQYRTYTNQIKALNEELLNSSGRLSSEQKKDNKDRLQVLEEITKAENEVYLTSLSQNEKQVEAVRIRYEELRAKARAAGTGAGPIARIDKVEKAATGNINYEQDTAELKITLDKQKRLYAEFEEQKKAVGEKVATERYSKELDVASTYLDKLQAELALTMAQGMAGGLTGPIQERLELVSDAIQEENKLRKDNANQEFVDAYNAAQNIEERVLRIRAEYLKKAQALGAGITESQKAELIKQQDQAILSAKDEAFKKSEIYKQLAEDTLLFTQAQLRREIKAVEDILRNTSIPADLKADLERELAGLKVKLEIGVDEANIKELEAKEASLLKALSNPLIKGTDSAKQYIKELKKVRAEINEISKKKGLFDFLEDDDLALNAAILSRQFGQMGGALSGLGAELSSYNEGLGDTVSSMGDLLSIASDAAGSVASFASGDIVGGITKAISAITGIFSIGRKSRESEMKAAAQMQEYQLDIQKKEREYQALLRDRERQVVRLNKLTLDGIRDQATLLGVQSGSIKSEYDRLLNQVRAGQQKLGEESYKYGGFLGIGRKTGVRDITAGLNGKTYEELERLFTEGKLTEGTKALFEQLQKLKLEGEDVKQALADLAQESNELFTGTTADSITDSIVEGFKNGYRTAEDFAANFEELMQNAMLNTFKFKVVQEQIDEFYKSFADRAKSDEQLTQAEIEALRAEYNKIITDSAAKFEDLQKITGFETTTTTPEQSGLKASIKREMTEATASELTGIYRASYELTKQIGMTGTQLLSVASQHLNVAIKTLEKTEEIAVNTNRLEAIEKGITTIANNSTGTQTARDLRIGG